MSLEENRAALVSIDFGKDSGVNDERNYKDHFPSTRKCPYYRGFPPFMLAGLAKLICEVLEIFYIIL